MAQLDLIYRDHHLYSRSLSTELTQWVQKQFLLLNFNRGDTKYHGGHPIEGVMPSPYYCKRYPLTCGCSRRKSLFLKFANAKAAATGFERKTRGDLSSLSNLLLRTKRSRPPQPTLKKVISTKVLPVDYCPSFYHIF